MTAAARIAETPVSAEAWDERFMAAALSLGRRNLGQTHPNPAVGALVVRYDGSRPTVIGRGFTARGGRPHAETEALRAAGKQARGATLYVTLEPCINRPHGSCADSIVLSGIARAVVALEDPNPAIRGLGLARLREAGVAVSVGVGAVEAKVHHAGHLRRIADGRPHVILKLAVSADGKSAHSGRRPARISCQASLDEAHMLRATSDAIMVGSGTVISDNPRLDCRLPGMADRSPIRVVLDGVLRTPIDSYLVQTAKNLPLWLITTDAAPAARRKALAAAGVEIFPVAQAPDGRIDLHAALALLGERGITRLLVEGGPILSAMLVKLDLVDEAVIVQSPQPLGPDAVPALEELPLEALTHSLKLAVIERRMVGVDSFTRLFRS